MPKDLQVSTSKSRDLFSAVTWLSYTPSYCSFSGAAMDRTTAAMAKTNLLPVRRSLVCLAKCSAHRPTLPAS